MSSVKIVKKNVEMRGELYRDKIVDIFVFTILCLFPLVYHNKYYDIPHAKYYFYIGAVILLLVALIIAGCVKHRQKSGFTDFRWKTFWGKFTVTDWGLIVFLLAAIFSTIQSDYAYEAFWGNEGRFSGLFLLLFYGASYFCVTRFGKFRKWYMDAYLIAGLLVCIFGITDYFQMDILKFKVDMREDQKFMFTSTVGNINTYTAMVGMTVAVSAVLFALEKNWKKEIFYYVCLVISLFALITGVSDNACLSLAALFGFLPLYLFNHKEGVKRYLIMLASLFTVIQWIGWINRAIPEKVLGIESAFNYISNYGGLIYIILALWLVIAVWHGADSFLKKEYDIKGNWLRYAWLTLGILVVAAVCYICYDANVNADETSYGAFRNYLIFNDDWGTHRGYIWRNAMESFLEFSPFKKLFGFGPDTFGIILLDKTEGNIYKQTFDNAHNEYLHYLLTVGIAGLVAYLVFLGTYIVRAVRRTSDDPMAIAALFAVICYCVQAFVNLNLPISTPLMWMLLTLGVLAARKEPIKSSESAVEC